VNEANIEQLLQLTAIRPERVATPRQRELAPGFGDQLFQLTAPATPQRTLAERPKPAEAVQPPRYAYSDSTGRAAEPAPSSTASNDESSHAIHDGGDRDSQSVGEKDAGEQDAAVDAADPQGEVHDDSSDVGDDANLDEPTELDPADDEAAPIELGAADVVVPTEDAIEVQCGDIGTGAAGTDEGALLPASSSANSAELTGDAKAKPVESLPSTVGETADLQSAPVQAVVDEDAVGVSTAAADAHSATIDRKRVKSTLPEVSKETFHPGDQIVVSSAAEGRESQRLTGGREIAAVSAVVPADRGSKSGDTSAASAAGESSPAAETAPSDLPAIETAAEPSEREPGEAVHPVTARGSARFREATPIPDQGAAQVSAAAPLASRAEAAVTADVSAVNSMDASTGRQDASRSQSLPAVLAHGQRAGVAASKPDPSGAPDLDRVETARFVGRVSRAFQFAQERGGTLRLRLSPPELGSLRIELTVNDGVLSANLEAETPAARRLLLDHLPALRDRLAEQSIRVERFDVDVRREGNEGQNGLGNQEQHRPQQRNDAPTPRRPAQHAQSQTNRSGADPKPNANGAIGDSAINLVV
jgi:flagellar hook-length control protein FliK